MRSITKYQQPDKLRPATSPQPATYLQHSQYLEGCSQPRSRPPWPPAKPSGGQMRCITEEVHSVSAESAARFCCSLSGNHDTFRNKNNILRFASKPVGHGIQGCSDDRNIPVALLLVSLLRHHKAIYLVPKLSPGSIRRIDCWHKCDSYAD